MSRSHSKYVVLLIVTVFAGLASRKFANFLPAILEKNAGDILYAIMVYFLAVLFFPKARVAYAAGTSTIICFLIEFWKLDQAPWLVAFRHTTAGGLILGHVFMPSNFACYVIGVALGVVIDLAVVANRRKRPNMSD